MSSVVIIAGVVTNILSVVGIVITNKYITEVDRFHYMVFLSFLHFLFTTVGTRVLLAMGVFSYKPAPLSGILPVAAGSLLSVAFMNLNLSYNSVGFYQVRSSFALSFYSPILIRNAHFSISFSCFVDLHILFFSYQSLRVSRSLFSSNMWHTSNQSRNQCKLR